MIEPDRFYVDAAIRKKVSVYFWASDNWFLFTRIPTYYPLLFALPAPFHYTARVVPEVFVCVCCGFGFEYISHMLRVYCTLKGYTAGNMRVVKKPRGQE